jgi:diguanylate cyclase (GGDEF)-like protein/PAS domain S-box-containing protein
LLGGSLRGRQRVVSAQLTVKTALSFTAHTAAARKKRLEQLESALALVRDAVVTADIYAQITYMNPAAERLTHWQSEDAVGQPISEVLSFVDTESGGSIKEAIDTLTLEMIDASGFRRAVLLNGTDSAVIPVIIEYSVSEFRDAQGMLCGTMMIFRDIMRRRTSELALQQSENTLLENAAALFEERERAQVTLNSIGDAVISTDFRGRVTYLNKIAEEITGWVQSDAEGRPLDEVFRLVDSQTRAPLSCPAMRAIIEDQTVSLGTASILIRKDGAELAVEDLASPIHDTAGGVIGAVMVAHDVTVAREQAEKLARLALYDSLTGLPNRTLLVDRLKQALENASRNGTSVSVVFLDLDGFKSVNDTQGHAVGDQLLQAVASRLLSCVRRSDTVCRYGGDEFVILLADIADGGDAILCAEKIVTLINASFEIGGRQLRLGASMGIASYPEHTREAGLLIKYADIAMYQAKFSGRNQTRVFADPMISAGRPFFNSPSTS